MSINVAGVSEIPSTDVTDNLVKLEGVERLKKEPISPKHEVVVENLVGIEPKGEDQKCYSIFQNEESLDALGMPPCNSRTQIEPPRIESDYPILRAILESRRVNHCILEIEIKDELDRIKEEMEASEYQSRTWQHEKTSNDQFSE
ncbi:hypothetical protein QAD02_009186 [Eretmocerus hayati]|uniref:Uncharacterized protein n=1 Tax=Eretmocerus hayati TaxID=131215 RepID=A0ACC2N8T7_9HYME|nr:hypothetical protein QAD02_009186 [Eretmocerus hayati]